MLRFLEKRKKVFIKVKNRVLEKLNTTGAPAK
jgi:hypothetical protein